MIVPFINRPDRNRVKTVCVPVEIAIVHKPAPISRRKHIDRSKPPTSPFDPFAKGLGNKRRRSIHRPPIVGRTPRARINLVLLIPVRDARGFIDLGDVGREDADSSDFGVVGDADAAFVVAAGRDFAGAAGAVSVVGEFGGGVGGGVGPVEVPGAFEELWVEARETSGLEACCPPL